MVPNNNEGLINLDAANYTLYYSSYFDPEYFQMISGLRFQSSFGEVFLRIQKRVYLELFFFLCLNSMPASIGFYNASHPQCSPDFKTIQTEILIAALLENKNSENIKLL